MRAFATIAITVATLTTSTLALADMTPKAAEVLDGMLAWYQQIPGASTVVVQNIEMPGVPPVKSKAVVAVLKPNLFVIRDDSSGPPSMMGMATPILASNGTTLVQGLPDMKLWSKGDAPKNLDVEDLMLMQMVGPASFVLDLFGADARASIMEEFQSVEYVGKDGDNELLRFTAGDDDMMGSIPVTFTIGPATAPWVKRLSITLPSEQLMPGMPSEMVFDFNDWKKLESTPEAKKMFSWTAPEDWKQVEDLMAAMMEGMPDGTGMDGPGDLEADHAMVGKAAPDFTLPNLVGTDVSLASLKGKTVILDFWATWCGPCRQGLPVLMEVADARKNDGVVLWAVDLDEAKKKVSAFLTKRKWTLSVLLDAKGKVASKYGVGGIPHTVVIDPQGVVRSVDIGFMGKDATKKRLNATIDEILKTAG
ncbi:MAG: redoxin domain-containing protein [Planctomycetes bacterium]|nr:redoxin domain-containing protein [Planctomycetota bacterium]MCP4838663.1 redoxin domain-containing protein [Planctomycetota bacterium]